MSPYVRVLGKRKRKFRGWERQDRIKFGSFELPGYVLVVKMGNLQQEFTIVDGKYTEGFHPQLLAAAIPAGQM